MDAFVGVGPAGTSTAEVAAAAPVPRAQALALLRDYVTLTKPRIISLLLLTTVATMFVADPAGPPLSIIL